MKKQKVLKTVTSIMIGSLLFTSIAPAVSAQSFESANTPSEQIESEAAQPVTHINAEQLQAKAKQMHIYDAEGNVTITDAQLVTLMRSQNMEIPKELKKAAMQRKNGVTKIVRKKGYTYIYLSTSMGYTIYRGSLGVATLLVLLTGGIGWGVAMTIVSTVADMSWSFIKDGIWLKFKGFRLVGKGRQ